MRLVAAFLVVDALVAVLAVMLLPRFGLWPRAAGGAPAASAPTGPPAALAGYPVLRGNQGYPVAVGRPWGTPCAPLTMTPASSVPQRVRARLHEVLVEAAAGGVPVVVSGAEPDGRPVDTVRLEAGVGDRPELPDGRPQRLLWRFTTTMRADGVSERIEDMTTLIFVTTTGDEPADQRRVLRSLLARSFGLGGSTRPGSGITEDLASPLDRFSPADLAALRAMAGCS